MRMMRAGRTTKAAGRGRSAAGRGGAGKAVVAAAASAPAVVSTVQGAKSLRAGPQVVPEVLPKIYGTPAEAIGRARSSARSDDGGLAGETLDGPAQAY